MGGYSPGASARVFGGQPLCACLVSWWDWFSTRKNFRAYLIFPTTQPSIFSTSDCRQHILCSQLRRWQLLLCRCWVDYTVCSVAVWSSPIGSSSVCHVLSCSGMSCHACHTTLAQYIFPQQTPLHIAIAQRHGCLIVMQCACTLCAKLNVDTG